MAERIDEFTGKPRQSVIRTEEVCEIHGIKLHCNCIYCGAPVCCEICCKEAMDEHFKEQSNEV